MSRLTDESHCGAISIYLAEERSSKRGLEAPILCAAFESKVRKNPKHTQQKNKYVQQREKNSNQKAWRERQKLGVKTQTGVQSDPTILSMAVATFSSWFVRPTTDINVYCNSFKPVYFL